MAHKQPKLTAVSLEKHQYYGFKPDIPFEFCKGWSFIDLNSAELPKLVGMFPMFFQKITLNGQDVWRLGLLAGFNNQNNFIHPGNGKFLLPYVPAALRAYPFKLINIEGEDKTVLLVMEDEVDSGFRKLDQDYIVGDKGLTKKGQSLLEFLAQLDKQQKNDLKIIDKIVEFNLMESVNIKFVREGDNEPIAMNTQLYKISEHKLTELKPEQLNELNSLNAFKLIYAHIFSLAHVDKLTGLSEIYTKLKNESGELDLEKLFDEDDSDVLKF